MVSISVVVCTLNRENYLKNCLKSLILQTKKPKEIVVVDDGSDKDFDIERFIKEDCKMLFKAAKPITRNIKIIFTKLKRNVGTPVARNSGIKKCSSDVVAFIEDDGYAHSKWLENLEKKYANGVIGVGGVVVGGGNNICNNRAVQQQKSWKRQTYVGKDGSTRHRHRVFNISEIKRLKKCNVKFFSGGNMSFRRDVLLKNCGFDYSYKGNAWCEETELGLRLSKKGRLLFEPDAITYHLHAPYGGNRLPDFNRFIYWAYRNWAIMFTSYFGFVKGVRATLNNAARRLNMFKNKQTGFTIFDSKSINRISRLSLMAGFVSGVLHSKHRKKFVYREGITTVYRLRIVEGKIKRIIASSEFGLPKKIIDL